MGSHTVPDTHDNYAERLDTTRRGPPSYSTSRPGWPPISTCSARRLGSGSIRSKREHPVGQLWLDILARDADADADADVRVAIENQLEAADLSHLGQLSTYATGSDAPTAVWVATGFRRELADALHRLNAWTRDGIRFYAVGGGHEAGRGRRSRAKVPQGRLAGRTHCCPIATTARA